MVETKKIKLKNCSTTQVIEDLLKFCESNVVYTQTAIILLFMNNAKEKKALNIFEKEIASYIEKAESCIFHSLEGYLNEDIVISQNDFDSIIKSLNYIVTTIDNTSDKILHLYSGDVFVCDTDETIELVEHIQIHVLGIKTVIKQIISLINDLVIEKVQ